jgi:tripartite-type tricarboxylate transporter receptor subunit TctC
VIAKLNAETIRGMNQTDVRERLAGQGLFVKTGTPAELAVLMQSEIAKWSKVVKAANLKFD